MTDHTATFCSEAWHLYDAYTDAINSGVTVEIDRAWSEYAKHFESCEKCTARLKAEKGTSNAT